MQLYLATALTAIVLIVVLSAGYAASERAEQERARPATSVAQP
jgi:hypothetical protein